MLHIPSLKSILYSKELLYRLVLFLPHKNTSTNVLNEPEFKYFYLEVRTFQVLQKPKQGSPSIENKRLMFYSPPAWEQGGSDQRDMERSQYSGEWEHKRPFDGCATVLKFTNLK